ELGITQSAISLQIRNLEQSLGATLFRRNGRAIALTADGESLAAALATAFQDIRHAISQFARARQPETISIVMRPGLALRWFASRLHRFRERHPGYAVQVITVSSQIDLQRHEGADCAIQFGDGHWPRMEAVPFLHDTIFPVMSPKLMAGGGPKGQPADLSRLTLIHDDLAFGWRQWLAIAGISGIDAEAGLRASDDAMALQLAVDGNGVALGRSATAMDELAAGRLVAPFDLFMEPGWQHYIVSRSTDSRQPRLQAFRAWLLDEAAGFTPLGRGPSPLLPDRTPRLVSLGTQSPASVAGATSLS
ncbi:MAG: LysR substrate-binding domain-containing protein, partial [Alphaproteobacteria bacterium]